jgi:hypothetical protein
VSALVPVAAVDWSLGVPAAPAVLALVPVAALEPVPVYPGVEGVVLSVALGVELLGDELGLVDGWLALVELEGWLLDDV